MKDAAGNWIGWGLGDVDPKVTAIKDFLKKKFSYASVLDESTTYDATLEAVVAEMQGKYGLPATGIFNYATQVKSGFVKLAPPNRPIFFSVEGHSSDMWHGPVADTGTQLEAEGRVHHQPIGYDNGAIPFDNASGENELARLVGATTLDSGVAFPAGTPWILGVYSQGAIVGTDFYLNHLLPGSDLAWRLPDLRGVLAYGNPCRQTGSCAPWSQAQAGPAANGGIDPLVRFGWNGHLQRPDNWMDVYRKGDIFADNEANQGKPGAAALPKLPGIDTKNPASWLPALTQAGGILTGGLAGGTSREGDIKSSVYQAVARSDFFSNPYSLLAQIADIFTTPLDEVIGIFEAIISGIGFLAKQTNPHYAPFDISGGLNWCRSILP